MKITVEKIVIAFQILNQTKLGAMKDEDKFKVLKAMRVMKPIANNYQDFFRDATEKLKPEGLEEMQLKIQEQKPLSKDEQRKWVKFNQDINLCLSEELKKEVEIEILPIEEESIDILVSAADFKIGEVMVLYDILGK